MSKTCSRCGQAKPLSAFNPHPNAKHGVRPDCKVCRNEYSREWQRRHRSDPNYKDHGEQMRLKYPGIFSSVISHKNMCRSPSNAKYKWYGARGIEYRFEGTAEDACRAIVAGIGHRPGPEYSLDRTDVNGHFELANLRWATAIEQSNNRRVRPTATEWQQVCEKVPEALVALRDLRGTG